MHFMMTRNFDVTEINEGFVDEMDSFLRSRRTFGTLAQHESLARRVETHLQHQLMLISDASVHLTAFKSNLGKLRTSHDKKKRLAKENQSLKGDGSRDADIPWAKRVKVEEKEFEEAAGTFDDSEFQIAAVLAFDLAQPAGTTSTCSETESDDDLCYTLKNLTKFTLPPPAWGFDPRKLKNTQYFDTLEKREDDQ
jgi:hypothetical protein